MTEHTLALAQREQLARITDAIHEQHRLSKSLLMDSLNAGIRAGELLLEARALVPPGTWIDWVNTNVPEIRYDTVAVYMRLARNKEIVHNSGQITVRGAMRHLSNGGAPDSRFDPAVIEEVKTLHKQGVPKKRIEETFGVSSTTFYRWTKPQQYRRQKTKLHGKRVSERRALVREQRLREAKSAGGDLGESYSLVRRSLDQCQRAIKSEKNSDARREIASAMDSLYHAEDKLAKAVRQHSMAAGITQ